MSIENGSAFEQEPQAEQLVETSHNWRNKIFVEADLDPDNLDINPAFRAKIEELLSDIDLSANMKLVNNETES